MVGRRSIEDWSNKVADLEKLGYCRRIYGGHGDDDDDDDAMILILIIILTMVLVGMITLPPQRNKLHFDSHK